MTDISTWLEKAGLEQYTDLFISNRIDCDILPDLTDDDLEKLEIPLGDRKRIRKAIDKFGDSSDSTPVEQGIIETTSIKRSAQRRQLTFVFADLVDSTSISERLDPEEYRSVIQKVHEVYADAIDRHKGWIEQYQGDGIFAYFGYPHAGEDDAERAVAASLSIIDAIPNIDTELDISLHVRVGINTGPVVVGDLVGKGFHEKNTVMGDPPNIGSKIQQLAAPDTILIADVTRRLLGQHFVCENLGFKEIAGLTQPIKIWQVKEEAITATRFEARHQGSLTDFVGHEDEVSLVQRRWQQSLGMIDSHPRKGQVVLISGEPGIGKSRLTQELCDKIIEDHTALHFQCSPHHRESAFHPIIMQLSASAGFNVSDSAEEKLKKLTSLLGEFHDSTSTVVSVFAQLLSIATNSSNALEDRTPKQIKDMTLESLLQRYIELSSNKPLLIVFEDLQWIDPTSQELLDLLIDNINAMQATLLATYRIEEYTAPWIGLPQVTTLSLGRLNHQQASELIAQQTGRGKLPDHLVEFIIQKTDGVPLFLEELTRAVLESKSLTLENGEYILQDEIDELILPVTLQDSLMSRLDRLPDARDLAPIGASIGRTFSYALLAAVTGLSAGSLRTGLDQLIDAQLLFEHGRAPESTYTFKHALVQDIAYESQLKTSRAQIHEKIAETLVSDAARVGRSRPEVIAHHYQEAGKLEEAFLYWIKAGDNAFKTGATTEAVELLKNANHYLSSFEETGANRPGRLDFYLLLGKALNASKGARSDEAEQAFWKAAEIAEKISDTENQIHALDNVFGIIFNSGNTKRSIIPADAMIEVGKAKNNRVGTTSGLQSKGMVMFTRGEFEEAKIFLEEALIDSEHNMAEDNSYPSLAFMYLAWTLYILGDKENAAIKCRESIDSARGLDNSGYSEGIEQEKEINYSLAVSLGNSCYFYQFADDRPSIRANAKELVDLAKSKGQLMWLSRGQFFLNWLEANDENNAESLEKMIEEVNKLLDSKEEIETTYYLGLIAETQLNLKMFEQAKRILDQALELVDKNGEAFYHAELLRIYGDLVRQCKNENFEYDDQHYYQESLKIAIDQSAKLWEENVRNLIKA